MSNNQNILNVTSRGTVMSDEWKANDGRENTGRGKITMLLILIILLILFGTGGGYRTYHHGARDKGGLLMLVLMVVLIVWLVDGGLHV